MNIQSNALRGQYMRDLVGKTINEIHDDVLTVFGPGATDAFITQDGQPYYTRDGLKVLESLTFSNKLSEYIRKIIYQAAARQGNVIGDGTTTLVMFYTNLYNAIINDTELEYSAITNMRECWNTATKGIINQLKLISHKMSEDELLSVLYTCTQDHELSFKLYRLLKDAIMSGSYITVNKSNIETDFTTTIYNQPLIKATRQFTVRSIQPSEKHTVILHCNGMLDIVHEEVLYGLMAVAVGDANGKRLPLNIILLCNGITETTRKSTKGLVKFLNNLQPETLSGLNNLAIYTLDNYRTMDVETIEDLSTIITDEYGIGGLVNSLTFEAMLYQAFSMQDSIGEPIPDLETFDCDLRHLDKVRNMILRYYQAEFDDSEGIRLNKVLGPVAAKRYADLRYALETEKSEVLKHRYTRRLRDVYGQFIDVEVGSKLIKESQRKYELILDATISSAEGVRYGVLTGNSIIHAVHACADAERVEENHYVKHCYSIIKGAFVDTFRDMVCNVFPLAGEDLNWLDIILNANASSLDLTRPTITQAIPAVSDHDVSPGFRTFSDSSNDDNEDVVTLKAQIVEPVTIMTNILENSTIPLELATAKTFHVNDFMQNYL